MKRTNIYYIQVFMFMLISNNIFRNNSLKTFMFLTALVSINLIVELIDNIKNMNKKEVVTKINGKNVIFIILVLIVYFYTVFDWIIYIRNK